MDQIPNKTDVVKTLFQDKYISKIIPIAAQ